MAKISELSDGGSLLPTDFLIAVRSGGNVKVQADNITVDRIDLGDNEKIRLGNSQDLEIFHDATDSIINDNGTGSLKLQQGGSTKLEVTTTGIDVTGTVTADGLTVEKAGASQVVADFSGTGANAYIQLNDGNSTTFAGLGVTTDALSLWSLNKKRIDISSGGDISFYEDTGTTAKLVWKAADESLGIGITPQSFTKLQVKTATDRNVSIFDNAAGATICGITDAGASTSLRLAGSNLIFTGDGGSGAESMRLNSTGSLILTGGGGTVTDTLGTASRTNLQLDGSSETVITFSESGTTRGYINGTSNSFDFVAATGSRLRLLSDGSSSNAVTLDTSGNLLVGKTATTFATEGIVAFSSSDTNGSRINITNDGGEALNLNRNTSDGDLAIFYKDTTTVGKIGSRSGVVSYIVLDPRSGVKGAALIGGSIDANNGVINPGKADGDIADDAITFGTASSRFKDLYLSEGINLSADDGGGVGTNTIGFKHTGNTAGYAAAIEASYSGDFRANLLFKINTSQSNTAPIEVGRFDNGGNLLVGDTSSSFPTNVRAFKVFEASIAISHNTSNTSGDSYVRFGYSTNTIGSITQNGTTAVLYNTSSDQRLKDNIVDAPSASDDIDAIQVRSFDWKVDGSHQKYGMVAQELVTVAPEAVSAPEDPEEMMGVDYSKLVPMLIKEVQQLRARVAQLEGAN